MQPIVHANTKQGNKIEEIQSKKNRLLRRSSSIEMSMRYLKNKSKVKKMPKSNINLFKAELEAEEYFLHYKEIGHLTGSLYPVTSRSNIDNFTLSFFTINLSS